MNMPDQPNSESTAAPTQALSQNDMLVAAVSALRLDRRDNSLGIHSMPEGYALILNDDQTHYYWFRYDYTEGYIDWNMWRVRRSAIANSKIQSNANTI